MILFLSAQIIDDILLQNIIGVIIMTKKQTNEPLNQKGQNKGIEAMKAASKIASENNISDMSLEEINNEIEAARNELNDQATKSGVKAECLLEPDAFSRPTFELFKSNLAHLLKTLGDNEFLIQVIESDEINIYYHRSWYPECLYLLAMVDYISRINDIPLCSAYEKYRSMKLNKKLYPMGIVAACAVSDDENLKAQAELNAVPEFLRFNIIESDVRNVI